MKLQFKQTTNFLNNLFFEIIIILTLFCSCQPTSKLSENNLNNQVKNNQLSNQSIINSYKTASKIAFGLLDFGEFDFLITNDYPDKTYNDIYYYKFLEFGSHKQIKTKQELIDYVNKFFDNKITQAFINDAFNRNKLIEIDNKIYMATAGKGLNNSQGNEKYTVIKKNNNKFILKVTVDIIDQFAETYTVKSTKSFLFDYEYINENWVFTKFPIISLEL